MLPTVAFVISLNAGIEDQGWEDTNFVYERCFEMVAQIYRPTEAVPTLALVGANGELILPVTPGEGGACKRDREPATRRATAAARVVAEAAAAVAAAVVAAAAEGGLSSFRPGSSASRKPATSTTVTWSALQAENLGPRPQ